ncbi:MAG: 2Fe-2S iron-sulfur cluster-binding protein [Actinomycetota bacterium]
MNEHYTLRVNGTSREVRDSWVAESLLYVLRQRLGLPGTKGACEQGECGSCTRFSWMETQSVHAS